MKAVSVSCHGEPEVLRITEIPSPEPGPTQVLVKVKAIGMNRADILQRQGKYPPPKSHSPIMGLECAGDVVAVGSDVSSVRTGARVFGLVNGGAYAEYCLFEEGLCMAMPSSWDYAYAAAIPENFFTAQETLFELGGLQAEQTVLIHAGGSGVGTAGIQMAHQLGARVFITAGSSIKIEKAKALGACHGINYKLEDFAVEIQKHTNGQGIDLVQDFIGADYFQKNISILRAKGQLVQVAMMSGRRVELDLAKLLAMRLKIKGFVLRGQSIEEKCAITRRFINRWLPSLEEGKIKPVIDSVFPIEMAVDAHRYMQANQNFGKILLTFDA